SRQMDKLLARELARESTPPSVSMSPPVQRQMDLSSERFRMNNPPFFSGARDPARVEEWIRTMEGIFEYADIPPRDQVKCATHLLRESARHWWDAKRRVINVSGLGWEDFKQMFFEKYFPPTYRNQMSIQFLEIQQGENSVDEYIAHFDNLSWFAPHMVSTNALQNEHFLRGLRPSLYGMVRMTVMQIDVHFTIIATKAQEVEEVERHIQQSSNLQESGNQS